MLERWSFDGWELTQSLAHGWAYRGGTDIAAEMRGSNISVPNRSGEVWRPKVQGAARFELDVWLAGANYGAVNDQWRLLLRATRRRGRLVRVDRRLPSGEVISCMAELVGQTAPVHIGRRGARATLSFNAPAGVWKGDVQYKHDTKLMVGGWPRYLNLTNFEPSTECIDDAIITFHGGGTSFILYDYTDDVLGDWFRYQSQIPVASSIVVNSATWAVTPVNDNGSANFSWFNRDAVQWSGNRLMSITAARPGQVPKMYTTILNPTSSSWVEFKAQRSYAC